MGSNLTRRVQDANPNNPGGEVAERPASIADDIRGMEAQFKLAMPRGMEAAQLIRDALTCLRTTPKLAECERTSVLGGLMTCAQLGLRPGVLGHAWLLPFWDKNLPVEFYDDGQVKRRGGHRAQLVIGYQGYRELAQRTGQISTLIGRTVYEHDTFDIDYGIADTLIHKPNLNGSRGKAVGYYAIVKYTTGGYAFWHMSKAEVEEHRDRFAMAKKKDGTIVGPWRDNFDEMAVKTAFLRLAKWMPKSTELAAAIEADETVRVDLSPNPDALLHGERPNGGEFIDGEVVPDEPTGDEASVGDQPPPAAEPPADDQPPAAEPRPSKAMLTKLHTLLSELGVTDRGDRLTTVSTLVQRDLASTNDLTKAEAMSVIDLLERVSQDKDDPGKALDAVLASFDTADGGEQA